jgi:hypothetical protein
MLLALRGIFAEMVKDVEPCSVRFPGLDEGMVGSGGFR